MFLINDDQAKIRQRRKYRQPRPQHDARRAFERRPPMLRARRFAQFAVQADQRRLRKTRGDALLKLRRQVDFRHQQQRLPAGGQRPCNQAQINLGFAAAGYAMQ